ncbi:hypothetical protein CHLRE_06g277750v5 [Chlamydomonas reinhardtii]|uniref:BACK domain-containing protein n=1 Tax=Chlamydomonas reinhardtii TaxID=3055 RepID=A0A2K3DNT6_CHLRE|nr:uncharacterized protein CHLRE_06g277750v5 [Chlamydomonas reinhardtii]PNW82187.1 hypothetical protein CHLRE_06g277750v5 [Chlamydomonas reinhardtii]
MSQAVRNALARRFGSDERSDCQVHFFLETVPAEHITGTASVSEEHALSTDASGRVLVGNPLPAHSQILSDGSARFCAELERWKSEAAGEAAADSAPHSGGGTAAAAACSGLDAAAGGAARPAKRQRVEGGAAPGEAARVQLYVGLWCPAERRLAEALLRYMYTGEIPLTSVRDLLQARPLAMRLAIEGGVEACDSSLIQLASALDSVKGLQARSFVEELHACRALLPEPASSAGADPTGPALRRDLMTSCRSAIARYCESMTASELAAVEAGLAAAAPAAAAAAPAAAAGLAAGPAAPAGAGAAAAGGAAARPVAEEAAPYLGELLAFAFEDTLAVLNDGGSLIKVKMLPPAALEALLASEGFGTDDEASVVLLLAEWRSANAAAAAQGDTMRRLLRRIRWAHVSCEFLSFVAPRVGWLGVSWERAAWLSAYARAPHDNYRTTMLGHGRGEHAAFEAGLRAPRRPPARPLGARPFSVDAEEATQHAEERVLSAGCSKTLAMGFAWRPFIRASRDELVVGLTCLVPASLSQQAASRSGAAFPGNDVVLYLHKGNSSYEFHFSASVRAVGIGGLKKADFKVPACGDAAKWWAQYLQDGQLRGEVVWKA